MKGGAKLSLASPIRPLLNFKARPSSLIIANLLFLVSFKEQTNPKQFQFNDRKFDIINCLPKKHNKYRKLCTFHFIFVCDMEFLFTELALNLLIF